jgi:predicted nucleotidyltransferase component of viral defense system
MLHHSTVEPATFKLAQEIFKIPFIAEKFALAGGTSLALQIGHRTSIDLDLFSPNQFSTKETELILAAHTKWSYQPYSMSNQMLFCFIDKIKCDFVHEPFPFINPPFVKDGIRLYSVADIAAMKLHTVCGRGKKKDFFDIFALLKLYTWKELLYWFEVKYGASQLFFLWKSITYFADADEDPDIIGHSPYDVTWQEVKQAIISTCRA